LRIFFTTLTRRNTLIIIPSACFLYNRFASLDELYLTVELILCCSLDAPE
jgi:hypothetical protein